MEMVKALIDNVPTATPRISPDEARAAVTDFLLDYVGNQLVAGRPHLMISAVRATWIVPVQLAYIHQGTLGDVGVVAVDEKTGRVIAWTPITQMKIASHELRATYEPALSTQFQTCMAANNQKTKA
jgi:hypothetical protein